MGTVCVISICNPDNSVFLVLLPSHTTLYSGYLEYRGAGKKMIDTAFVSYVTVMSITPGPNNLLLAASGVNFGLRRTVPMMLGITVGCVIQCALTTSLLAILLSWMQVIRLPMAVLGCAYLFWLSWKIFRSGTAGGSGKQQPM